MNRIRSLLSDRPGRIGGASSWRPDRRQPLRTLGPWLAVVVVAALIGAVAGGSERIGLVLAALVLGLGIYLADPMLLAVIVLPGSLLLQRVGGSGTNLSVADLLVFLAGVVCLFHVRWREAGFLRQFLKAILWYQAVLILVVMAHPNRYDIVEWFHRFSYLAASVLVGWVVATSGRTRQTLRLFLWCSALLAVLAMEHAVSGHFQPAQWGSYQKNAIGAVMWVAVAVAQINPPWAQLRRAETRVLEVFCIGGLLASQSRQAAISLIVVLVAVTVLNPDVRRRSKLALLGLVPLAAAVYYSFSIAARNNPQFNSVSIRFGQIGDALNVWHLSPVLGLGMRFYYLPQYVTVTAPPNVIIDNLASTGIVGSIAFLYLVYMTMRTMGRLPYVFGTLGLAILLGHYVDGLFDIFFIGASMIPPFLIAGISLGLADADRRDPEGASTVATNEPAGAPRRSLAVSGRRRWEKSSGSGVASLAVRWRSLLPTAPNPR